MLQEIINLQKACLVISKSIAVLKNGEHEFDLSLDVSADVTRAREHILDATERLDAASSRIIVELGGDPT